MSSTIHITGPGTAVRRVTMGGSIYDVSELVERECPECLGSGRVEYEPPFAPWRVKIVECDECGGHGVVWHDVEEE